MHERLKLIRETPKMSQAEFSKALGMGQSTLAMMEVGKRDILDRHIKTICSIFNVSEKWLRTGEGEMSVKSETFSLDKYAADHHMTDLELEIVKGYFSLDEEYRKVVMDKIREAVKKHEENEIAATTTTEKMTSADLTGSHDINDIDIEAEVESYRRELEAEKGFLTSEVSQGPDESAS